MDLETLRQRRDEAYQAMLMEYASGCLDEAHALLIAAHISLSPNAQHIVARYETIGGVMLEKSCAPAAMTEDALQKVMAKLDAPAPPKPKPAQAETPTQSAAPRCLHTYICRERWVLCAPGRQTLALRTHCNRSEARLFRLEPGAILIPPATAEMGVILILEGAGSDGLKDYSRGDMIVIEPETVHPFQADAQTGAEIMLVQTRPQRQRTRRFFAFFLDRL